MAKITLTDVANLENETTAVAQMAANNTLIENAIENTLSRDGTSPNQMGAQLDMNSNRIINLPAPVGDNDAARLIDVGDAPSYAAAAAASAAAALVSETNASSSASSASSSALSASTDAATASAAAALSTTNATVVVGDEYSFATSTSMADPGTGLLRLNNATVASVTAIAISSLTNAAGNPNKRTYITSWDDATNAVSRGTLTFTKIGTPGTYAIYNINGALTDNTTWVQLAVSHRVSAGTWSASDRVSVHFTRSGSDGSGTISGNVGATDNRLVRTDGVGGITIQNSPVTIDDSGNITGVGTVTSGATVVTATSANALAVGPNGTTNPTLNVITSVASAATGVQIAGQVAGGTVNLTATSSGSNESLSLNSKGSSAILIGNASTGGVTLASAGGAVTVGSTIELGHASDTTLSRASAGVIAVEGVNLTPNIPVQSQSAAYTAVLADANTAIYHPSSDNNARTFTIPANASVAYPVGTTLTFINDINTVTIAITTDTLVFAGPNTTGSRSLAAGGMATAIKVASTRWYISGSGLT